MAMGVKERGGRNTLLAGSSVSLVALVGAVTTAQAAAESEAHGSDTIFFIQLGLLLVVGRLMGELAQRVGQPAVMGQLLAGLVLGPSVFGVLWPEAQHALFPAVAEQKSMINAVSQLGILMLLLVTGMETDLKLVRRVGRAAITVSAAGVAVPFVCGFALGEMLPDSILPRPDERFITSLFLGTALSISSVKIVAMVVREMNFMRRNLGQIIVASAILEDTIGWIIIAIAFGLAAAGTIDVWSVARSVLGTAVFLAASLTIGRRIVFSLIRWTNDNFSSEFAVITMILAIMIAMALTTHAIGVHFVLGAFIAGILVGESPILTRHIDEQLRGLITALFMPVFFGVSGLSADLTVLRDPYLLLLTILLVLIASVGKFAGAFIGGQLGGLTYRESLALACGMNARGSTEVIVASIGLSMNVLSPNLFTMIVTMAIVTTMAMPPMLRWALARLPLAKDEKQRLEREEIDARGFVTNIERLLLAVDESTTGKFAARLAGVIAGSGGKPITIIDIGREGSRKDARKEPEPYEAPAPAVETAAAAKTIAAAAKDDVKRSERVSVNPDEAAESKSGKNGKSGKNEKNGKRGKNGKEEKGENTVKNVGNSQEPDAGAPPAEVAEPEKEVRAAAETVAAIEERADKDKPASVEVTTRPKPAKAPEAIAEEARKGYGLMVIGIDKARAPEGGFSGDITRIAEGFDGPLAVVVAGERDLAGLLDRKFKILIAVNGTDMSRRAAEIALALARVNAAQVTALYIVRGAGTGSKRKRRPRGSATRLNEEAVLKDFAALADRHEVTVRTAMRVNVAPEEAILREAKRGRYDLIVLGVGRRPGHTLSFGNTAAGVLDGAEAATVFVAS